MGVPMLRESDFNVEFYEVVIGIGNPAKKMK